MHDRRGGSAKESHGKPYNEAQKKILRRYWLENQKLSQVPKAKENVEIESEFEKFSQIAAAVSG